MRPRDPPFTRDEVAECLSYDPQTGEIRRIAYASSMGARQHLGKIAGTVHKRSGYRWITFRGRCIMASRLAWLLHYGVWPSLFIDHIDGDKLNNRISNLREATRTQNNRNAAVRRDNKLGVRGICFDKQCPLTPYRVAVGNEWIGHFKTLEEAKAARDGAVQSKYGAFHAVGRGQQERPAANLIAPSDRDREIVFPQRMPAGYKVMWWSGMQMYGWEHDSGLTSEVFCNRWAARRDAFAHAAMRSRSKYAVPVGQQLKGSSL